MDEKPYIATEDIYARGAPEKCRINGGLSTLFENYYFHVFITLYLIR